jgi:hypothetical protein
VTFELLINAKERHSRVFLRLTGGLAVGIGAGLDKRGLSIIELTIGGVDAVELVDLRGWDGL